MDNQDQSDDIKKLIDTSFLEVRSSQRTRINVGKIISRIKKQQNVTDMLNFGLIRFWLVLLSFFSVMYARHNKHAQYIKSSSQLK